MTKYSLIQLNTGCSPDKSYQILEKYIIKAVSNGSKLVCTPETTNIMEIRNSKNKEFQYLTHREIQNLDEYEREKYYNERDEQIVLNPEYLEIQK